MTSVNTAPTTATTPAIQRADPPRVALDARVALIVDRFRAMPRVLRWGLVGALLLGGYALLDMTTWAWARDAAREADLLKREVDRAARRPMVGSDIRDAVLVRGEIRLPRSEAEGAQALVDAVNEIVKGQRDVSGFVLKSRASSRLQSGALAAALPPGARASKVTREIEFEAPPDVVSTVIGQIESNPEIDAISVLRLEPVRSEGGRETRRLAVQMVLEAWVIGEDRVRR